MPTRRQLEAELAAAGDPVRAANSAWFFKTGKGQYGEGDRFLGIKVPVQRQIALRYRDLPLPEIARLLASPIHEFRFAALEILVAKYERGGNQEEIVAFYLSHTAGMNNWDLVDTAAPYILGDYLKTRPRKVLDRLAASKNLWQRRIAIVSTLALIKSGELDDTFRIAGKLLADPQNLIHYGLIHYDLIHKAVGWALREAGRVSRPALLDFLQIHHAQLPRTTLRYAIEHFSPTSREQILAGTYDFTVHNKKNNL